MFIDEDLVGQQQDIELFNNIGCLDSLEGRLTVLLSVNPIPRVRWEFETARGEYTYQALSLNPPPKKLTSWDGSNPHLVVEKPTFTSRGGRRRQSIGYAELVLYGNVDADAHYFDFYLPNTDFMREATNGDLEAITEALKVESFVVNLGNDWSVELFTTQDALNWLKPEKQNRGSMITLRSRLFQSQQASTDVQDLKIKSLAEANQLISDLCLMLSYINGGYTKPVYVRADKFIKDDVNQIRTEDVAALAESPLIAPQEEIGQGFLRSWGIQDLLDFIKCFPSFQRMLHTSHWGEKWILILEWYFQAIPRLSGRRRNVLLPVLANALGTLLENLARLILVDDEPDPTKRQSKEAQFEDKRAAKSQGYNGLAEYRLNSLLNHIGISSEGQLIKNFIRIRNHATHANPKPIKLTNIQQWEVILRAIQWVDEVILWKLGYAGQYRERSLYTDSGIQPRYNLSLRNPNW